MIKNWWRRGGKGLAKDGGMWDINEDMGSVEGHDLEIIPEPK